MVIMDGFNTSHSVENLETLETEVVKKFVGEREAINPLLDTKNPVSYGPVALQNSYFEFRIDQELATQKAAEEYRTIAEEYGKISGRHYDYFEEYRTEDAEKIMVLTGSAAGTAKVVADHLRDKGEKVGILKINLFRPFPHEEIAAALKNAQEVIVLDRAQSVGTKPPFYTEIISSLYQAEQAKDVKSYVYGLGGRDIFQKQIEDVFEGKIENNYLT